MQRSAMLYIPLLTFLIRYRRTALGPLWLVIGPSLFIAVLGFLYAEIGAAPPEQFIPHLAVGLVTWTLIGEFTNKAPTVYQRGRANIMQGGMPLGDIVLIDAMTTVISFLHQLIIFIPVFLIYSIPLTAYSLVSILGCGLLIVNGILFTRIFGILGSRYRDLSEVIKAIMRIAFLATPIIWIPGGTGRGGVMEAFLNYNPFYHFLELVRAPLLGNPIELTSWLAVLGFTFVGLLSERVITNRYARYVPLWV